MNELLNQPLKAILFDYDDTLAATIAAKWAQHRHIAKEYYGIDSIPDELLKRHWGEPLGDLVCNLYNTTDSERALAINHENQHLFPKELYPYTIDTLQHFKQHNLRIGVITATVRESLEFDFRRHPELGSLFDYTQTASESEFHKPDPRVFDQIITKLALEEISPEQTLYVGDSFRDYEAAKGAGFSFIGVTTGLTTAEEFAAESVASIANVGELPAQLQLT